MNDAFQPGRGVPGRRRWTREPLPPYSYVPGHTPHPASDPRGHAFAEAPAVTRPLDERNWQRNPTYLLAIDLFNHGYYWEAHEAWEALWHAAGRRGPTADGLKGLIKLAAAAVKLREGNLRGARRHLRRGVQLLSSVGEADLPGIDLPRLLAALGDWSLDGESAPPDPLALVPVVLPQPPAR